MDWDQIEIKWAEMTQRVRGDWVASTSGTALSAGPSLTDKIISNAAASRSPGGVVQDLSAIAEKTKLPVA